MAGHRNTKKGKKTDDAAKSVSSTEELARARVSDGLHMAYTIRDMPVYYLTDKARRMLGLNAAAIKS